MLQMKKENYLKPLLGLTQEEATMLFNVTRIQWAQYTTGRREISVTAKLKLAEVLTALNNNKKSPALTTKLIEIENKLAQDGLHQELKAIKFKTYALDKKIVKIKQVRADAFKALEVAHYLESEKAATQIEDMASFIQIRIKKTLKKNSLLHLQELELKKESLQILKTKIEEKIKIK